MPISNQRGVSLVGVLAGAAVGAVAVVLIGTALKGSTRALSSVSAQKERSIELMGLTNQLKKDFGRRQTAGVSLLGSPVFKADSPCHDLAIRQTILPSSVRTVEYRTVCDGAPPKAGGTLEKVSSDLAAECAGRPRILVRTTEPAGKVSERRYPAAQAQDAQLLCFAASTGPNGAYVEATVVRGAETERGWKTHSQRVHLGMDDAGDGIELIPPQ